MQSKIDLARGLIETQKGLREHHREALRKALECAIKGDREGFRPFWMSGTINSTSATRQALLDVLREAEKGKQ